MSDDQDVVPDEILSAKTPTGEAAFLNRHVPTIYAEAILGASVGGGTVKLTFVESVFNPGSENGAVRPTHHLVMSPESFGRVAEFIAELREKMGKQSEEKND